jgi:hypothetical protein
MDLCFVHMHCILRVSNPFSLLLLHTVASTDQVGKVAADAVTRYIQYVRIPSL